MRTLLTKLVRRVRDACDRYLKRADERTWTPTCADGSRDPMCSYCGYLCDHCGRPY